MTARKTTPHLKRGPKPKPKPPKLAWGRPAVPLRQHPDRFLLARYDVAAAWLQKGRRLGAGTVLSIAMQREREFKRMAANRLRRMAQRYTRPEDMAWRQGIATAVALTIQTPAEPATSPAELEIIESRIIDAATCVGEVEWAQRELLPLLTLRLPSRLPFDVVEARDLQECLAWLIAAMGSVAEIERLLAAFPAFWQRLVPA
jgi:hypothetical protein